MAQQEHYANEKLRFAAIAVFGVMVGLATGHLWICTTATFAGYCLWLLSQARQVDLWLQKGAKRGAAPDTIGVIGNIEKLIFRSRQSARERKKRLKKIVGWYNRTAAALPDATVITNTEHEIAWANTAAEHFLGIVAARDGGQRIDNLVRSPDFQAYLLRPQSDEELEIKSPQDASVTLAIRRVSYAENLVLFSARDVSARVRLRETRQAFVDNASHELKTPLTVVNGHLELLEQNPDLPAPLRSQVTTAADHTRRMTEIVTDLLTLSKLEHQTLDNTSTVAVPVARLIDQLCSDLRATHAISLDTDPSLLLIGNEQQIKSLCSNLISNALQHTPEQTEISVSWKIADSSAARLEVSDTGPGIPVQHLNHITERFYRVDTARSRETGGTGLGLSIVKHIVSGHNGVLEISSTPGVETVFSAVFPAGQTVRQSVPAASRQQTS